MHTKREKIFEAAIEKFSQKGATSTTMQEIAKEAGVGKGTLYRYFENKEDLVSSLISSGFKKITEDIEQAIGKVDDPTQKLEQAITVALDYYNQHRNFCKFLTRENWGYKNKFEETIRDLRSDHTVVIEKIIAEGIATGKFKDLNVEIAASSLLGIVNITALHWFMFKKDFPVKKIKNEVLEIYFSGIIK